MNAAHILQPFCAVGDIRHYLNQPYKKGDYLFASDGSIMVSMENDGLITDPELDALAPNNSETLIRRDSRPAEGFIPLEFTAPEEIEKCSDCKGTGKEPEKVTCDECRECDGDGRVGNTEGKTKACVPAMAAE